MRPVLLALLLALAAAPAAAQPCGPITFSFGNTGPGCAPFGGTVPTLTASLVPSPVLTICPIQFVANPGLSPLPVLLPVFLVLGISNPMLDLAPLGLPGCTLLASLEVVIPMTIGPAGPVYAVTIPLPASPSMIGAMAFGQAAVLPLGPAGTGGPRLSNGVAVSIL